MTNILSNFEGWGPTEVAYIIKKKSVLTVDKVPQFWKRFINVVFVMIKNCSIPPSHNKIKFTIKNEANAILPFLDEMKMGIENLSVMVYRKLPKLHVENQYYCKRECCVITNHTDDIVSTEHQSWGFKLYIVRR